MYDHLPGLLAAMAEPRFYPHPVERIAHRETHASHVFLTGPVVYKIKKPVNFGFLDYSTLAKRKACCEAEVKLNRRLTQGIYQGVVPFTGGPGEYALGDADPIVEYGVCMTQLADQDALSHRLKKGSLPREIIGAVACKLAAFYDTHHPPSPIADVGIWETVWLNNEENFTQTEAFCGHIIDRAVHRDLWEATRRFLNDQRICFDHRVDQGFVKDCHGDLRCDHVYLGDEIQIIDCIEFNQRFRFGDLAADLGFLSMDLDFKKAPELAQHLILAYARKSRDFGIYAVLDYYKCYRAVVRCKINCFKLAQDRPPRNVMKLSAMRARSYLELARRYALRFSQPMLWIFCGQPATGKSTLAGKLADALRLPWLQSDVIRKELAGIPPRKSAITAFGQGIYTPEFTSRVYGRMAALAKDYLTAGHSLVLDATFSQVNHRRVILDLAAAFKIPVLWVVCEVEENVLRRRLKDREKVPSVSDARLDHLEHFKSKWEPLEEISEASKLPVNTGSSWKRLLGDILARGHQVKKPLPIRKTGNEYLKRPPPNTSRRPIEEAMG
jgi:aminoglycoside phosphotransferase family enzyme/predicted kinase